MKRRFSAPLFAVALVATLVIGPSALAHHGEGKELVGAPPMEVLEHEFHNVVAANANPDSSAPRGHAPCIRGMAADTYPCHKVDMLSHLTLADLGLSFANDMWGWTDPQTRKDYALIGGIEGVVIVDISDPKRPDVIGTLPTHTTGAFLWRDLKVHANHMFVVSEDPGHGMQVFDLTQVRGVTGDPVTFSNTAHYDGFGNAHNLAINEDTGFAYAIGTSTCNGGLHMVDIGDPDNPTFAGCFEDHAYIHDTQCVIYEGPDADYRGREICFNSAADGFTIGSIFNTVSIVDVTDKTNPVALSRIDYPDDGYSHQGWLTPDQEYFLHNDELDELLGPNGPFDPPLTNLERTTTRIWDVRDLEDPVLVETVQHRTEAVGHNAYTEGRYLFASNYMAGLQVFDITKVGSGEMEEVAYFDVFPDGDAGFNGTWSNYPYFHQKKIVAVSTMDRGLFILQPRIGS